MNGGSAITLHSFAGAPAPPPLVDGWKHLLDLSQEAWDGFWSLLAPALLAPADPNNHARLESFSQKYEVSQEHALAALQACGLLFQQASALDLGQELFRKDLATLSDGESDRTATLAVKYDEVKGELRKRIAAESLIDHGKVLTGVDWRVDNVVSSDRGTQLNATVVFLTLRYREGDRTERITLQLTPEALKELKVFTERISR